jgi:chloramphenicol 3-O phosphotransferase
MDLNVIVLNGGSSSGKTEIARLLQALLPQPWLTLGVDMLIQAMPNSLLREPGGLVFEADGAIAPGPAFGQLEAAWMAGVAAMARAGARVIVDDVFLGAASSQERWRSALGGLAVVWVGVKCAPQAARLRELTRGDRTAGMAEHQALAVHAGVAYDLVVDTTDTSALVCARRIVERLAS